jgi:hypothetical protein
MSTGTSNRPWYREPWPWLLMLPPFGAVIGGFAMLALAVGSPDALVVDDYAHIEDFTRAQFEADRRATELELHATVALASAAAGRARISVELAADDAFAAPHELTLRLRHAARADADREALLVRDGGAYVGETELAAGRYTLELSAPGSDWRLEGTVAGVPAVLELEAAAPAGAR